MPNYRRAHDGNCFFFTLVSANRNPVLCEPEVRTTLRYMVKEAQHRWPFEINAWVLMPDHLHTIWTLPLEDRNYSRRWGWIKKEVTKEVRGLEGDLAGATEQLAGRAHPTFWQRRFWEHRIRDERDFANHCDYIHYNPVKHGLCSAPADWPFTTFHRFMKQNIYPPDWGADPISLPNNIGNE